jgi:hypothetical protein
MDSYSYSANGITIETLPLNVGQDNAPQEIILLNLRIARPGIKRKLSTSQIEVDADKESISASKQLLSCSEYKALEQFDRAIRTWAMNKCLPAHKALKEGIYRVAPSLVEEIESDLNDFLIRRNDMLVDMRYAYGAAINDAQVRLRSTFNRRDYLDTDTFIERFQFTWSFFTLAVPSDLPTRVKIAEQKKFAALQEASLLECKDALRVAFAELVNRAVERLACDPEGKPLIFKSSLTEKLEDFLQYFQARNLADDTTLASLVEQAKNIMREVPDATALRTNSDLREKTREAFSSIQTTLIENGITERPSRNLELD